MLLLLSACKGKPSPSAVVDIDASSTAAPAPPPTATAISATQLPNAVDEPIIVTKSFATFERDKLDECLDITVVSPAGSDRVALEKELDLIAKKATPASVPCAEQFADRVALATCGLNKKKQKDGGAMTVIGTAFYYNVATVVDSDSHMRDCMSMGGKWQAPSKTDPKIANEIRHQRLGAIQGLTNTAQDMAKKAQELQP